MKKSFRVYLFFQIVLATGLILLANRQVAQHFLAKQMEARAHQEMARVLTTCEGSLADPEAWASCNQGVAKGDVLNPLNEFFVPCGAAANVAKAGTSPCAQLSGAQPQWDGDRYGEGQLSLGRVQLQGEDWHVLTSDRAALTPAVLMADASLWFYLRNVWALRDRNLIYVLPTIILMLGLLTAYMVYVVMRPIRLLEKTLSTLDFKNIRERSVIEPPYVEFQNLANVYRDLLERLYESYDNAKRFASDAAHELRTPLSILRGNVERMIPEAEQGSESQQYVQNLSDEVDRLVLITEKLLMLSRADNNSLALDLVPLNLSEYLTDLIEDAPAFHPHIQFVNRIQPNVIWMGDKALMEQLINNLYSNAVKYNTPRGGWIAFELHQHNGEVRLTVKNASVDVAQDLPKKAFERFYRSDASRTRRTVDGLGLGLSICKEIALAHGGSMHLDVEDGHIVSVHFVAPVRATTPA
jgi:signal transduction histidine kinase